MIIIYFAVLSAIPVYAGEPYGMMGDINGDNKVGLEEAIFALQTASGISFQGKDESEPNDSKNEASQVGANSTVLGKIGYGSDNEDWYKIVMPANGLFQFTVKNLNASGTDNGRIGRCYLYQLDGLTLAELASICDYPGAGRYYIEPGQSLTSAKVAVSDSYTYYIKIPKYENDNASYELQLSFLQLQTDDNGEPNDIKSESYIIQVDTIHTALIGYEGDDEDWYEITIPANGIFQFSVENLHPSGVWHGRIGRSYLYQLDGLTLVELASICDYPGAGRYYIEPGQSLTSAKVAVSGGYTYFIKIPKYEYGNAPYQLQVSFFQLETDDSKEPNRSQENAAVISEDSTLTALIGYEGDDEDWYEITMSANGTFQFSVENLHPSGVWHGRIGRSYLYQLDGLTLVELASICDYPGAGRYYIEPGQSLTSAKVAVSDGYTYFIKIPKYEYSNAPYQLIAYFVAE